MVLSMIIGILIKFDELVFEWSRSVGFGWLIALTIQIAIAIALFLNRNKLLMAMSTVQRGVSNPRYLRNRMRLSGNVYADAPKAAKEIKRAAKWTAGKAQWIGGKAASAGEGVVDSESLSEKSGNGNAGRDITKSYTKQGEKKECSGIYQRIV